MLPSSYSAFAPLWMSRAVDAPARSTPLSDNVPPLATTIPFQPPPAILAWVGDTLPAARVPTTVIVVPAPTVMVAPGVTVTVVPAAIVTLPESFVASVHVSVVPFKTPLPLPLPALPPLPDIASAALGAAVEQPAPAQKRNAAMHLFAIFGASSSTA